MIDCRTLRSGLKMHQLVTQDQKAVQNTIAIGITPDEVKQIVESNGDIKAVGKIMSNPCKGDLPVNNERGKRYRKTGRK